MYRAALPPMRPFSFVPRSRRCVASSKVGLRNGMRMPVHKRASVALYRVHAVAYGLDALQPHSTGVGGGDRGGVGGRATNVDIVPGAWSRRDVTRAVGLCGHCHKVTATLQDRILPPLPPLHAQNAGGYHHRLGAQPTHVEPLCLTACAWRSALPLLLPPGERKRRSSLGPQRRRWWRSD
jgi:hypothetical protein